MKPILQSSCALLLVAALISQSHASSPGEKVICSDPGPRTRWMSEPQIRQVFGEQDFTQVKLKISRGNCYEFYAVHKDGSIVEAYYHPISGQVMRYNRVEAAPGSVTYKSSDK